MATSATAKKPTSAQIKLWDDFAKAVNSDAYLGMDRDAVADLAEKVLGLVEARIEVDAPKKERKPRAKKPATPEVAKTPTTEATPDAPKKLIPGRKYKINGNQKYAGVVVEYVKDSPSAPDEKCSVVVIVGNDNYATDTQLNGIPKRALSATRITTK